MSQVTLEVKQLTKQIKKKKIVDDVSFTIQRGEIFGLLGPNGAGKTTIIRMIVHLINRTNGKIIIGGYDLDSAYNEAMSEIGAIVENPEFYKYMSGMKNLKHYMRMAIIPISEERLTEVIELVGLKESIHQKVKTYSLGMRQRLGVAQALLHNPSLLILDEPTNGLDPQGIREFRENLRLLASKGVSVLVSSHLLSEMELMCDRFAIIEEGKLIHISTMQQDQGQIEDVLNEVSFVISDTSKALNLLQTNRIAQNIRIDSDKLFAPLNREAVAIAVQLFVQNGISVYEVNQHKTSLEDRFLEITNKERKEAK